MTELPSDPLPPEVELALAWSPPWLRASLGAAFQLDRRLARIVARTTEPMLGQMRLAWWRGALGQPLAERPRGDAVLDAIGVHWIGRETALVAMVDGWEVLVTAESLTKSDAVAFAGQRSAFFEALLEAPSPSIAARVAAAGKYWALADAAAQVSDPHERELLLRVAKAEAPLAGRLPGPLRGLAVLEALSRRALRRGGGPLMDGRGASLTAVRAAIFLK